jgi:SAM-dependent methyltransferase
VSYGTREYWEERYRAGETEDWLQTWPALRPIVSPRIARETRVAILGCGTSTLGEEMWDDGWRDVVALDYVGRAATMMQARAAGRPGLRYLQADVRRLPLPTGSIAAAIDKSTLDALMCHANPELVIGEMRAELARVLRPGGVWICVSMRPPDERLAFFDGWQVTTERISKMEWRAASPRAAAARAKALAEATEEERIEMTSNWVYVASYHST